MRFLLKMKVPRPEALQLLGTAGQGQEHTVVIFIVLYNYSYICIYI